MNILGIGTVCSAGVGIGSFENALQRGWREPSIVEARNVPGGSCPVYQVNLEAAADRTLLKKIRRADKLSKMAVVAAAEALRDGGVQAGPGADLGVIVATAFGAHVTTFGFLDNILDYGDAAVSPTTFSNSVHNAAASYVASSLDIKGPTLTVTQFRFSFQAALQLAETWIDQKRCASVLVGAVDQYGDVLGYICDRKLTLAKDGRIKPFMFNPTCLVPGEGAAFFLLGAKASDRAYCSVKVAGIGGGAIMMPPADIAVIDADGMLPDESVYLSCLSPDVPTTAYSPLSGSMMTGSSFNAAAAALMLKHQVHYAAPVQDNPHGLRLLAASGPARIESIRCVGYDCSGRQAAIQLTRLEERL